MIISAVLWGTHPTIIQLADWTVVGTSWVRSCFCAIVMLVYVFSTGGFSFKSPGTQILSGGFLAANSALFVGACTYTSPANAVVLMFTFPWITMGLDYLSDRKLPHRNDIIRLLLGMAGVVIIVAGGLQREGGLGNIFALFAGFAIALHIFFSQRLRIRHGANREVLNSVFIAWLASIFVFFPFAISGEKPPSDGILYLALFSVLSAIPWLLWGKAIAYISGHVVAALLGVEAFVATMVAWLVLGQVPGIESWLGGSLILLAATWQIAASSSDTEIT